MQIGDKITFRPSAWEGKTDFSNGFVCPRQVTGTVIYVSKKGFVVAEARVGSETIRETIMLKGPKTT